MTWYNIRHVLIWVSGFFAFIFGVCSVVDMGMVATGNLDPMLWIIDMITTAIFGLLAYGMYDMERDEHNKILTRRDNSERNPRP